MRKAAAALLFFTLVISAFAQSAGEPGIGDDFYPMLGNGGYDVQTYLIDLTISDDLTEIDEGIVTIRTTGRGGIAERAHFRSCPSVSAETRKRSP
jgi:hypothetical protein